MCRGVETCFFARVVVVGKRYIRWKIIRDYRKNINEGSGNNVELLTNDIELYLVIFFSIEIIIVRVC